MLLQFPGDECKVGPLLAHTASTAWQRPWQARHQVQVLSNPLRYCQLSSCRPHRRLQLRPLCSQQLRLLNGRRASLRCHHRLRRRIQQSHCSQDLEEASLLQFPCPRGLVTQERIGHAIG